jgi:hypothetical protein
MLIDEKLKSFEVLISRLRHLERLDITFPDTTTILEMSDLLFLGGQVGFAHPKLVDLRITVPRINTAVLKDGQKMQETRMKKAKGVYTNINFYEEEYDCKIEIKRLSAYLEEYRCTPNRFPSHK